MKRLLLFLVALLLLTGQSQVFAQKGALRVAIFDPSLPGHNDPALQMGVRELISNCFVNHGGEYAIVERSQLDKVMQEAKFTNSDAVDESQATELGRLAGADKVVLSVISKMGTRSLISIKMINVETASVEKQQSKLVETESLLDVIEPITLVILGERSDVSVGGTKKTQTKSTKSAPAKKEKTSESKSKVKTVVKDNDVRNSGVASAAYELPAQPEKFLPIELMPVLDAGIAYVVYDLSDATVEGFQFDDYIQNKFIDKEEGAEDFFYGKFQETLQKFVNRVNDRLNSVKLSMTNASAPVTLVLKVRVVGERGNKWIVDYVFIDTTTKEVLSGIRMETSEGVLGSFTNLMGDVWREAAEDYGRKLNDSLKKASKMR